MDIVTETHHKHVVLMTTVTETHHKHVVLMSFDRLTISTWY
jgi:hypothetical protein